MFAQTEEFLGKPQVGDFRICTGIEVPRIGERCYGPIKDPLARTDALPGNRRTISCFFLMFDHCNKREKIIKIIQFVICLGKIFHENFKIIHSVFYETNILIFLFS